MKVIIPGGSGQVGTILARAFQQAGHEVVVFSRRPAKAAWRVMEWDAQTLGDWTDEIEGADVVINLAGRNVNCRYNAENRRLIKESRVKSTRIVGGAIARLPNSEFMSVLRSAWGVPFGLPAAAWMLEVGAFFLRTETELILKSRRVIPGRLMRSKFVFRFPAWAEAAQDLCNRWREAN